MLRYIIAATCTDKHISQHEETIVKPKCKEKFPVEKTDHHNNNNNNKGKQIIVSSPTHTECYMC